MEGFNIGDVVMTNGFPTEEMQKLKGDYFLIVEREECTQSLYDYCIQDFDGTTVNVPANKIRYAVTTVNHLEKLGFHSSEEGTTVYYTLGKIRILHHYLKFDEKSKWNNPQEITDNNGNKSMIDIYNLNNILRLIDKHDIYTIRKVLEI